MYAFPIGKTSCGQDFLDMSSIAKSAAKIKQRRKSSVIPSARQMNLLGYEANKLSMSPDMTKVPVSYNYNGGDKNQIFNFQVVYDTSYTPADKERRIAIRGGYGERAAWAFSSLTISGTGDFDAPTKRDGSPGTNPESYDEVAICKDTIADGDLWFVWLAFYNSNTATYDPVAPDTLIAEYGTSRPVEPATDNYLNYCVVLGTVENDGGSLRFRPERPGGNHKDFSMVPDSIPMIETNQFIRSIGYVTDSINDHQNGLLQDYNAYEQLITASGITNTNGDFAIPYFDYDDMDDTTKEYARVDGINPGAHNETASIYITSNQLMLYEFDNPTIVTGPFDATALSGAADNEYSVLMRYRDDANFHELRYVDISDMNVASADIADTLVPGTLFSHPDLNDMPDAAGIVGDHDVRHLYNVGTGGRYSEAVSDDFETDGYFFGSEIGLIDTGAGTGGDPYNNWDTDRFRFRTVSGAEFDAFADHQFKSKKVSIQETIQGQSSVGALEITTGGAYINDSIWVENVQNGGTVAVFDDSFGGSIYAEFANSGNHAGYLADSSSSLYICDESEALLIQDGAHTTQIGDGTNVLRVTPGGGSATVYNPMTVDVVISGVTKTINVLGSLV